MKLFHYCVWAIFLPILRTNAQQAANQPTRTGKIVASGTREALGGATLFLKGKKTSFISNSEGNFSLPFLSTTDTLLVSHIGFQPQRIVLRPEDRVPLVITLEMEDRLMEQAVISTGYERLPKERATGSFVQIDNELLNRSVSPGILSRLDGVTSGLVFNQNIIPGINQSDITIRGRSTLFSNADPLIVVDNFPYDGNIDNINPNDVESITILKDAAAASIWGVQAGNGVIVISTKKGKYNQPLKISVNSNLTLAQKPNLYYSPRMNSSDYIDVEKFLYTSGWYANTIANGFSAITPVVNLLNKESTGQVSPSNAEAQINAVRSLDVRNDLSRYFYRGTRNQQYSINLNGGSTQDQYYFSAGYDKDLASLVRNQYERISITANNTYSLLHQKMAFTVGLFFAQSNTQNNNSGSAGVAYPYAQLAGAGAIPLAVSKDYRKDYTDTAGGGQLLDWSYRPLQELSLADNTTKLTDYRMDLGLKYKVIKGLEVNLLYQYSNGQSVQQNYQSQSTYYARDLINQFTQLNGGSPVYAVPLGGILDRSTLTYQANNLRGQLNYTNAWKDKHLLTIIAGAEIKNLNSSSFGNRFYGYDPSITTSVAVDNVHLYPLYEYYGMGLNTIPGNTRSRASVDRYYSYYTNAAYTFRDKYTLSLSGRKDKSNLFGVSANQKGVPLGSIGLAWLVSREKFYSIPWLPYLKLRLTGGYNGNVNKTVSAFTTATTYGLANSYNVVYSVITNPPNPSLQWEKDQVINMGLDFAFANKRIEGTLEYYSKTGKDLIGMRPLDPTTGVAQFTGNTADMKTKGYDITLNTININRQFKWVSTILFSYASDRVTKYLVKQSVISAYLPSGTINPLEGKPVYAIYSLKWMGLDSAGNPRGVLNGKISTDYASITNSSSFDNLVYNGPANPTFYGSFRNTFSYKQVSFSFNITYKFGYYFRRTSINYSDLYNGRSEGHPDYEKRWQQSGDEKMTSIPSMLYPANNLRDYFYSYSQILVDRGDNIRLQDLQVGYDITRKQMHSLPFQLIRIYLYANNMGILWRANRDHIDPNYIPGAQGFTYPNPKSISIGAKIDL